MFRETPTQRSLFSVEHRMEEDKLERLKRSWAQAYRSDALPLIDEKKFALFFDPENGRPNKSVKMLVSVLLLKEIYNLTDREALEQLTGEVGGQEEDSLQPSESSPQEGDGLVPSPQTPTNQGETS